MITPCRFPGVIIIAAKIFTSPPILLLFMILYTDALATQVHMQWKPALLAPGDSRSVGFINPARIRRIPHPLSNWNKS